MPKFYVTDKKQTFVINKNEPREAALAFVGNAIAKQHKLKKFCYVGEQGFDNVVLDCDRIFVTEELMLELLAH